jgi:hypothetical protein
MISKMIVPIKPLRTPGKVNDGERYRQVSPENLRKFTIFTMIHEKAS